jgi:hypothetical protein
MQPCLFSIFRDEQQNANSRSFSDLMPEDKRLFFGSTSTDVEE